MKQIIVYIQAATFLPVGIMFLRDGNWRLGLAQIPLGGVTALVYL